MRTLWVSGASILATAAVAGVQLCNALLWTAYVTFLPDLVRSTGLGSEVVPLILLVDQIIFVVMDPLCGFGVQSLARRWWLVGPLLLGGLFISSIALLALPSFSQVGALIFLILLFIWVMTASVLRAPVMALLHRHVPPHAFPGAAGVSLLGLGLAGALSPYFGILIKTLHPLLPFAAASAAVLLSALTLMIAEFLRGPPEPAPVSQGAWLRLGIVLIGFSSLALAFQLHSMVRMVQLWSALMGSEQLPMVMPTFWIGFSLAIAPFGLLSRRWPLGIVCGAGLLFTLGTLLSTLPFFPGLLAGQLVAGLGWAGVFVGALSSVVHLAPSRWIGPVMGGFLCITSLATLARISITMSGLAERLGTGIDALVVLLALMGVGGVAVAGLTGGGGRAK